MSNEKIIYQKKTFVFGRDILVVLDSTFQK